MVAGGIHTKFQNDLSIFQKWQTLKTEVGGEEGDLLKMEKTDFRILFLTCKIAYKSNFKSIRQNFNLWELGEESGVKFKDLTLDFDLKCGTGHTYQVST